MRRILAACSYVLSFTSHWWWEFVRSFLLYEPASHMLNERIGGLSVDTLVQLGGGLIFFGAGTWLIWPSRPVFLQGRPIRIFLERDSGSNLLGVQSFPGISYIQMSFTALAPLTRCKTWMTIAEFSDDGIAPYAVEHSERVPLKWSKHSGPNDFEADINPADPPVRNNVLVYDVHGLRFDYGSPTNLLPLLQRIGFHRLTIAFSASKNSKSISATRVLTIHWRGTSVGAVVFMGTR